LAKLIVAKSHTLQNIHLQKHKLIKEAKKQSTNGESLNQTHCSCYEKKKDNKHTMLYLYGTKDLI
jgi:hypothetical protein